MCKPTCKPPICISAKNLSGEHSRGDFLLFANGFGSRGSQVRILVSRRQIINDLQQCRSFFIAPVFGRFWLVNTPVDTNVLTNVSTKMHNESTRRGCLLQVQAFEGTMPLMLRITKERKRKYVSIGLSIDPKFWDFDKNRPKRNCPNKEAINNLISAKLTEYNGLIMEMTTEQREYIPATLVTTLERKTHFETVDSFYRYLISNSKNMCPEIFYWETFAILPIIGIFVKNR